VSMLPCVPSQIRIGNSATVAIRRVCERFRSGIVEGKCYICRLQTRMQRQPHRVFLLDGVGFDD